MATVRVGMASEADAALPLRTVGRDLSVSYAIKGHKTAFGRSSVSGGGEVHSSGYATHSEAEANWLPPQLQRVALDVGLGAAGAGAGAYVDGVTGAVVGGVAAVAWSRWRFPPPK